jgi:hypothetical protein
MSGTQEWNIRIVATNAGNLTFQPWGVGANPGDAAQARDHAKLWGLFRLCRLRAHETRVSWWRS